MARARKHPLTTTAKTIELPDGSLVTVEIGPDRDYTARLDIVQDKRRWTYGVDSERRAILLSEQKDGSLVQDPTSPEYLREILDLLNLVK